MSVNNKKFFILLMTLVILIATFQYNAQTRGHKQVNFFDSDYLDFLEESVGDGEQNEDQKSAFVEVKQKESSLFIF